MRAVSIRVTGLVQGVGFRAFVRRRAEDLGLVGAVWNQRDGSVAVIAQGPDEVLSGFTQALEDGPGVVKTVSSEPIPVDETRKDFVIFHEN